jgi:hypothetical protein
VNDLEKKQDQRRRFLRMLYDQTGGRRFTFVLATDLRTKLALNEEELTATTDYLVGRGWMKWETLDGKVSITPLGVGEVERALAAEVPAPTPRIPAPVVAEIAQAFESEYTHAQIDNLFMRAGAVGEAPGGSKLVKVAAWLRQTDADQSVDAVGVLGRLLEDFMEKLPPSHLSDEALKAWHERRERVRAALASRSMSYQIGGRIIGGTGLSAPSKTLSDFIRTRDLTTIEKEFERAAEKIVSDPEGAVTAACAILEATCHTYIAEEKLTPPADKSLHPLWKVVQGHLGIAPTALFDEDLRRILGGLASIVDGVGSFRTHAGDAHGRGPGAPPVEPRHARLAVSAAHTVVTFILETWETRRK